MSRALLLAALLCACSTSLRDTVRTVSNGVADVAETAGPRLLASYCRESSAALHREATYHAPHCVVAGESRAATPDEAAALAHVREQWAPVLRAYDAVADAHAALVAAVTAEANAGNGDMLGAMAEAVRAYAALVDAAHGVGVMLPALPGAGGGHP